ncbi:MAG: hypothetical protein KF744_16800 [Taibaiella sp.]|nr:hypothetical protein [Taibaiella sp.]
MKKGLWAVVVILFCIPFFSYAQRGRDDIRRKPIKVETGKHPTPKWAEAHGYKNDKFVYFPDYYLFYTPVRGYVYWSNNDWTSSQAMPAYVNDMNLIGARAEILNVPVAATPEQDFKRYYKEFPSEPSPRSGIPVPPMK